MLTIVNILLTLVMEVFIFTVFLLAATVVETIIEKHVKEKALAYIDGTWGAKAKKRVSFIRRNYGWWVLLSILVFVPLAYLHVNFVINAIITGALVILSVLVGEIADEWWRRNIVDNADNETADDENSMNAEDITDYSEDILEDYENSVPVDEDRD